jgi:hypothetical protein
VWFLLEFVCATGPSFVDAIMYGGHHAEGAGLLGAFLATIVPMVISSLL